MADVDEYREGYEAYNESHWVDRVINETVRIPGTQSTAFRRGWNDAAAGREFDPDREDDDDDE